MKVRRPAVVRVDREAAREVAEVACAPVFDAEGVRVSFASSGRWVGRELRPVDRNDREPD